MTWLKICGTTTLEDALLSLDAGADALGFIFAPSPRRITAQQARQIIAHLPQPVEKVGVFVNESEDRIAEIAERVGLTAIQLHGDEPLDFARRLRARLTRRRPHMRMIRALPIQRFPKRLGDEEDHLEGWDPVAIGMVEIDEKSRQPGPGCFDAILVDSGSSTQRGGTGKQLPWESAQFLLASMTTMVRLILAGGLNPENVGEAVRRFRPWGVDVVSGVEAAPGKKDPAKLRAFVGALRRGDKEHRRQ